VGWGRGAAEAGGLERNCGRPLRQRLPAITSPSPGHGGGGPRRAARAPRGGAARWAGAACRDKGCWGLTPRAARMPLAHSPTRPRSPPGVRQRRVWRAVRAGGGHRQRHDQGGPGEGAAIAAGWLGAAASSPRRLSHTHRTASDPAPRPLPRRPSSPPAPPRRSACACPRGAPSTRASRGSCPTCAGTCRSARWGGGAGGGLRLGLGAMSVRRLPASIAVWRPLNQARRPLSTPHPTTFPPPPHPPTYTPPHPTPPPAAQLLRQDGAQGQHAGLGRARGAHDGPCRRRARAAVRARRRGRGRAAEGQAVSRAVPWCRRARPHCYLALPPTSCAPPNMHFQPYPHPPPPPHRSRFLFDALDLPAVINQMAVQVRAGWGAGGAGPLRGLPERGPREGRRQRGRQGGAHRRASCATQPPPDPTPPPPPNPPGAVE
jgi:hypothetical protein